MSILNFFKDKGDNAYPFKPNNSFYSDIGISKKRFAMISKNKSIATHEELTKVSKYLKLSLEEIL